MVSIKTIYWDKGTVKLIDQRKLPDKLVYVTCRTAQDIWRALKTMQVRGAPAIGVAAGFGVYLGMKDSKAASFSGFKKEFDRLFAYLYSVRPTAVNLRWALLRMKKAVSDNPKEDIKNLKKILFREAIDIMEEDKLLCRRLGRFGSRLIKNGYSVLTHCNAGGLATADYGTALGVMFAAHEKRRKFHVYVDETRPVLQGARLTAWELIQAGINCTLICDNMAGSLMKKGRIDIVIVGADRIARNGDIANKIGTYSIACLAKHHKIPFYVAAPASTFDLKTKTGKDIPIEERNPSEITHIGRKRIAPKKINVFNPAFDITPGELITAFITEKGIIKPPYKKNIMGVISKK